MNFPRPFRTVVATLMLVSLGTLAAKSAGPEPVHITIGYQPYYAESWGGLVVKDKELWKKYLPPGSTVDWEVGLQGAVITNNMLAGKYQFGYVGDMPGIVAATKRSEADIRLLELAGWANQACNIFVVRPDAPQFKNASEAIKWMNGKQVAVPKGSCGDRFAQEVFKREHVTPAAYLNQGLEVITTNLRAGKLDAAVIWEPSATHVGELLGNKSARLVATGADWGLNDSALLIGLKDYMDKNPDVAVGLIRAELDAEKFITSNYPKNACDLAQMAVDETIGYDKRQMWYAMYGEPNVGKSLSSGTRYEAHVVFDAPVRKFIEDSATFLNDAKVISNPLPPDAIFEAPLKRAMMESKVKGPIGSVHRQTADKYPCT
jgi:NitT/TauT family transport system substrate-binding protein